MTTLLMISRGLLLVCVLLYVYYFIRRKRQDNVIKMWVIIVVGLLAGVVGKLIEVNLGYSNWGSIQLSFVFSLALMGYSLWKLSSELKNRR